MAEEPAAPKPPVPPESTPEVPVVDEEPLDGLDATSPTLIEAGELRSRTTAQSFDLPPEDDEDDALAQKIRKRLAAAEVAASSRDPLIGAEIGGRFRIVSKIGEGGMGAVYRARQSGMDRDVAIKVLLGNVAQNEVVVKRFHLEAYAVSKLRHPNTIQIYDFGETEDGRLYIAMEFLEGVSLHATLDYEGVLSVRRSLRIAQQMGKSLREAHSKGIVHRDLKPDNIFLQSLGEEADFVKVLDFGVAKIRDDNKEGTDLTKTGTIFGTPKYMSPEQARGGQIDPRADLYAIGIILYEMLTGRVPFDAESSLGILIKHIQEPYPTLDESRPDLVYPEAVHVLIDRLLAKRPEDRPQSAEAFIREVANIERDLDDIYRNVVTHEEAVRIGLELTSSPKTRHDTRLTGSAPAAMITEGPFQDQTVEKHEAPRRRWPLVLALMGALLAITTGGFAAAYAGLQPLPDGFVGYPGLTTSAADVGTVAPVKQEIVHVILAADPADAEIYLDGQRLESSPPLHLERPLGSAPQRVIFRKSGFKDASTTVEFHRDRRETLRLTPIERRPRPASAAKPATTTKPKATGKKPAAATAKPATASAPATTTKPKASTTTKPKATTTKPKEPENLKVDRLKGTGGGGLGLK